MAWLKSTGLKEKMKGDRSHAIHAVYGTTISFGDGTGTGGRDQILDSGSGLAGFTVGDHITVLGSTSNNITEARILSVAAGAIEVAAGTLATEAAGDNVFVISTVGGSFLDCFKNGVIALYSGSPPASADLAEVGTLLVTLTLNGDTHNTTTGENGINFSDSGSLTAGIETDPETDEEEVILGTGTAGAGAGGTSANSCWIYDQSHTTGASSSAVRMVGTVAVSGADCNMPNGTTVVEDIDVEGTSVAFTF